jgi:membrane protein DedA with SNARE-associated domain
MADQKITSKERLEFALPQVGGALRWIALSGTATYFLTELLRLVEEVSLPTWAVLVSYVVINTLLFAVAKFVEGQESK